MIIYTDPATGNIHQCTLASSVPEGVTYKEVPSYEGRQDRDALTDVSTMGVPQYDKPKVLAANRKKKIEAIYDEAMKRVEAAIPSLDDRKTVMLMKELWPMLNTAGASANMVLAKDIFVHAKTKVDQTKTATQTQLDNYDETTDTSWPV